MKQLFKGQTYERIIRFLTGKPQLLHVLTRTGRKLQRAIVANIKKEKKSHHIQQFENGKRWPEVFCALSVRHNGMREGHQQHLH